MVVYYYFLGRNSVTWLKSGMYDCCRRGCMALFTLLLQITLKKYFFRKSEDIYQYVTILTYSSRYTKLPSLWTCKYHISLYKEIQWRRCLCYRGHSKSMSPAYHRFFTPLPPCHTLSPFALTPSPLVTTQIVTNFELIINLPFRQISDLIFSKMCIFSTQTLLSTWKATLKSR